MLRKLLIVQLFSLFLLTNVIPLEGSHQPIVTNPELPVYALQSFTHFEGDKHGDFVGDLVAILNDGSCWKVHPKDQSQFSNWKQDDAIYVSKRPSDYWFKREHKFQLNNLSNGETVRVMLVQYPAYPLKITDAYTLLVDSYVKTTSWVDAWGYIHYNYYTVDVYHKRLHLSNGTTCTLTHEGSFGYFCIGDSVYIGYNQEKKGTSFFIVSGLEREANWAAIY